MSVDQRPARVKVYSSGAGEAARVSAAGPDEGRVDSLVTGDDALAIGQPSDVDGGPAVLAWCLVGALTFLVGSGLGGMLLTAWLWRYWSFS